MKNYVVAVCIPELNSLHQHKVEAESDYEAVKKVLLDRLQGLEEDYLEEEFYQKRSIYPKSLADLIQERWENHTEIIDVITI